MGVGRPPFSQEQTDNSGAPPDLSTQAQRRTVTKHTSSRRNHEESGVVHLVPGASRARLHRRRPNAVCKAALLGRDALLR